MAIISRGTRPSVGDCFRAVASGVVWRIVRMLDGNGRRLPHVYLSREGEVKDVILLSTRCLTEPGQVNWARVAPT
jgi:hypothetical protein